jgi:hypothetical protein
MVWGRFDYRKMLSSCLKDMESGKYTIISDVVDVFGRYEMKKSVIKAIVNRCIEQRSLC